MSDNKQSYFNNRPDAEGYFGRFGGNHYPPELRSALQELATSYQELKQSPEFHRALNKARVGLQGRPTPIHHLENISKQVGGAQIYVKREDLNHTGAHKINHCVGFALLAKQMGKKKLIAETGAGQHGVALATAAAYFGLECEVHMGEVDVGKQSSNVGSMQLLGARVVPVASGQSALKDASDSAFNAYVEQLHMHFMRSARLSAHTPSQPLFETSKVYLPEHVIACVAGGSNAMGIYTGFIDDPEVVLHAVEPLGTSNELGQHAATLAYGRPGTLHGARSIVLQQDDDTPASVSSVASGLAYPGVGPEIAMLHEAGRLSIAAISDKEVIDTFFRMAKSEGIIPALESAHALAFAIRLASQRPSTERILVNLSGRGDKDIKYVLENYRLDGQPCT
ncbi:tryptophan synthase beta chain [Thozetella sp. PMI_491]|nr:tryptophan synthase beta chain [Thozetella sp. PMI_491]